jgi:single-strand DNA-binding protein
MINKLILVGNVWRAPEKRTTKNDLDMCILYMVTKESILDKNTQTYTEKNEWHNIVCFGTTATYILKNIHVGDILYVEGQLQTRDYLDTNGNKKYVKDVIIPRNGIVKRIYAIKKTEEIEGSQEDSLLNLSHTDDEDALF